MIIKKMKLRFAIVLCRFTIWYAGVTSRFVKDKIALSLAVDHFRVCLAWSRRELARCG